MKNRPGFTQSVLFKMVLRSILMIVVTLGLVEVVSYRLSSEQITDLTVAQMVALTKNYRSEYDNALNSMEAEISLLGNTPALFNYFKNKQFGLDEEAGQSLKEIRSFFQGALGRSEWMRSVRLIAGRSSIVAEARRSAKSPSFQAPPDRSGLAFDSSNGSHVLVVTQNVRDETGIVGRVEVVYDLDSFAAKLRGERIFKSGHLAVLGKDGRSIVFPNLDPGSKVPGDLLLRLEENLQVNQATFDFDDQGKKLVSVQSLQKRDWYVVSIVPQSEMFAVLVRLRNIIVGIVCLNILVELMFLTFFVRKLISGPVNEIVSFAELITAGNYDLTITPHSKDEIGILARKFDEMRLAIRDKIQIIEGYSAELEKRVEERTHELKLKNRETQLMLDNLKQGIFMVNQGRRIEPQYSQYLETILDTSRIKESDPFELLLSETNLNDDRKSQVDSAVDNILGQDEIAFEFNGDCLPREVVKNVSGDQKVLEIDWVPISDPDLAIVDRMMVILRDVTEFRKFMLAARKSEEEMRLIGRMVMQGQERMKDFFAQGFKYLQDAENCFSLRSEEHSVFISRVFLCLHTLKGNARSIGLSSFVEVVHHSESFLQTHRDPKIGPGLDRQPLRDEVQKVRESLSELQDVYQRTVRPDPKSLAKDVFLTELDEKLQTLDQIGGDPSGVILHEIIRLRDLSRAQDLSSAIEGAITSLGSIAKEIGKPTPRVEVSSQGVLFKEMIARSLGDIFMHLLRNSIDHGIELESERQQKRKAAEGRIEVVIELTEQTVRIHYRDDGRGLNVGKLRQSATSKRGVVCDSDEEAAAMIFEDGVSTAAAVTQISGRGVGMSAVREFLRNQGGDIRVVLDSSNQIDSQEFRSFEFWIDLPRSLTLSREGAPLIAPETTSNLAA